MTAQPRSTLYRPPTAFDVLRLPVVGKLLRWRYGRLLFQLPLAVVAVLLIIDGFTGPQLAARNLATVASWVHYRGLILIALLLAGNLFCMGCPFTLPRTLAKRLAIRGRRFPPALRGKWLALGGLFALFFLYEWLDMWSSPVLTAWVIIVYFVGSFVLEALFTESAFCKYVCPLGTFNFVYSTVSPLQITTRNPQTCALCVGKECINGSFSEQPVVLIDQIGEDGAALKTHANDSKGVLGCGTLLFVPQIKSNLDCTLCLDCARACPHNNVGLIARNPGAELLRPDRWLHRYDIAFLAICLTFMGLTNAFGMIPPVYALMQDIASALWLKALGLPDSTIEGITLAIIFGIGNLILPIGLALAAAWLTRKLTRTDKRDSLRTTLTSFAPAFVPLGFGIWAAHYGFHFLVGALSIIPVLQEFFGSVGDWSLGGLDMNTVGVIQVIALLGGFLASMIVGQRIAARLYRRDAMGGYLPWGLLLLAVMFAAYWIFTQPMEMRGTITFH